MSNSDYFSWFVVATAASIVLAFLLSLRRVSQRFGSTYRGTIFDAWFSLLGALLPVIIYSAISIARGGWEQIFYSPELSAGALTILFMGCHELCLGLSVKHNWSIAPERLGVIGGWALVWLIASVISVVLIYQTASVPSGAVVWQVFILVIAVVTYFFTAVPTRLLRAGYVPKPRKV